MNTLKYSQNVPKTYPQIQHIPTPTKNWARYPIGVAAKLECNLRLFLLGIVRIQRGVVTTQTNGTIYATPYSIQYRIIHSEYNTIQYIP